MTATKSSIVGTRKVPVELVDPFRFGNPREMDAAQRAALAKSIEDLGYVDPVMVREVRDGKKSRFEILDGHHRYDFFKGRGDAKVEVLVVDVPDDAKARMLALSLNRIGADWKTDKLAEYVDAMLRDNVTDADAILATSGFGANELEQLARVGTSFLDEFLRDGGGEGTATAQEEAEQNKGATPDTLDSGDRVKIHFIATPPQHRAVYDAIKAMRTRDPEMTTIDALARICAEWFGADAERRAAGNGAAAPAHGDA